MDSIRLILGDQLLESISSLKDYKKGKDLVLICEVWEEARYVKHHKKKIAFLFSAMRHFAKDLINKGYNVAYTKLDDSKNTGTIKGEIKKLLEAQKFNRIVVTHPGEYRVFKDIQSLEKELNISVEIRDDDRFLCSIDSFTAWASNRKQLRMEYFYRKIRKEYGILMQGDEPAGGQWNYDSKNRKSPNKNLKIPKPYNSSIDDITNEVLALVENYFKEHIGSLRPFNFGVTRKDALEALNNFIEQRLNSFGDYQDAMLEGEPWMYHSHLSFYLNCGLLLPLECVKAAELAYYNGKASLNSVEGFIRQVIGWREFVRGVYWMQMPNYANFNFFEAKACLPDFYWTAKTKLNCLRICILETLQNAYAHHIQRLMILGNFALLAGVNPKYVNEWFLMVYADAYEWVELPNVSGMALFADGGFLASKPYAAGGSYINKMSNYCKSCSYNVNEKIGDEACPFNYLYWDFLDRNRAKLVDNTRISVMYKTFELMGAEKQKSIKECSKNFLRSIYT